MAWLDDHPPARRQFTCPRRQGPSGVIVVHTAENTPDFVAFDGGAEAVANFIRTRDTAGSYHDLADSDSIINLVRYECEAYHDGTGSNPHSYGVSGATRADVWPLAPEAWRRGCVRNMALAAARYATWLGRTRGIAIPARRITRDQSTNGVPGFISHAQRDPDRRTDPGKFFPWDMFLADYSAFMGFTPVPTPEYERHGMLFIDVNSGDQFVGAPGYWHHISPADSGPGWPVLTRETAYGPPVEANGPELEAIKRIFLGGETADDVSPPLV